MIIDLRSDTVTQPDERMRQAMARARVGDDVYGEDPTVKELEAKVAALLGMEAALFLPSGTMANLCALLAHTRPGEAVLLDRECHVAFYEAGGMARVAGVMPRFFPASGRAPRPAELDELLLPDDIHFAPASLLCLENTHNRGGGTVIPPHEMEALVAWARGAGLRVHVDGARLFNAAVALGCSLASLVRGVDSVMVSLSKGLAAPVGSVLAGRAEFIETARRARKLLGGGMRQAGVLAAAGLVALEEGWQQHLERDHQVAEALASALSGVEGVRVRPAQPRTNIVLVDLEVPAAGGGVSRPLPAHRLVEALQKEGVLVSAFGPSVVRLVTHRHVEMDAVEPVVKAFRRALDSVRASHRPSPPPAVGP